MAQSSRVQARQFVWARTCLMLVPALALAGLLLLRQGVTVGPGQAQTQGAPDAALRAGQTVGQSFVTRQGGLTALDVYLRPAAAGAGAIELHLRADVGTTTDLATAHVAASAVTAADYYRFSFPIQRSSNNQSYFFELTYTGAGAVAVASAAGGTYHDGAQYQNGVAHEAQTAFRPVFDRSTLLLALGSSALGWAVQLLVQALLFVLPGWVLLDWLLARRLAWAEQLALSVGVTLALFPLLLLYTDLIGLHAGVWYAWLPVLASASYLVLRSVARRNAPAAPRERRTLADWLPDIALVFVLGLAFLARMVTIQPFEAPLWGDSVQHSVMAQLFLDHGGLFTSWEPYTPYQSLTVQYGFPLFVALFAWASGIGSLAATLVVGQTLNMCAALTLYPLATRVANGNRWAGVGAVLVAGLLSPMPAFYLNWGRDAQLAGQVVLPVALWLLWETLDARPWRIAVLTGAVLAGMGLVYYRMPFYYAAFVPALLLGWALPHWRFDWRRWLAGGLRLAVVGAVAIVLLVPWALRVKGGTLADTVSAGVTRGSVLAEVIADYQFWWTLTTYVPAPLLGLSAIALVWSLATRRWQVAALALWIAALALIVAGRLLHIPGTALIQNIAVLIALYIPVSLLVGALLGEAARLAVRWRPISVYAVLIAVALAGLWGAAQQQRIGDQAYEYVTRPDQRAMAWIRRSTPPDTRFLVEGFSIWSGTTIVGADAGWWLPLLAGRANTMPPQYAILNERPSPPDYTKRMVGLVNQIQRQRIGHADVLRTLCHEGITHVYVGQLQGAVGVDVNTKQLFSPTELARNPAFRELYHQDRVYVFALEPAACRVQ